MRKRDHDRMWNKEMDGAAGGTAQLFVPALAVKHGSQA